MAIYHFDASVISRSKGRSATAASAYRAAERVVDLRTGEVHDYTRKDGVLHTEIIAPERAPNWARERSSLWNAVEAIERRKDAQVSREVRV
ncbi:MobA/MobL family protein, partial [Sulfitobacter sp. 1A09293]